MLQDYSKYTLVKRGRLERLLWFGLPPASFALLLLFTFLALSPIGLGADAYAESSNTQTFSAYLFPSITLELPDLLQTDVQPTLDGTFSILSTVAHVEVRDSDFYSVTISGGKDLTSSSSDAKITGIASAKSGTSFDKNEWGYTIEKNTDSSSTAITATEASTYKPMSPTGETIPTGSSSTSPLKDSYANDYYSLNFGAKVSIDLPADVYSTNITFSVVANPKTVSGLAAIDTMQQLTATACSNIGKDPQDAQYHHDDQFNTEGGYWAKQLIDERDGNVYWMAKLADGNCWMTQNLALSLSTTNGLEQTTNGGAVGKLTSETSNVSGDWTPQADTRTTSTSDRFNVGPDDGLNKNAIYSWNEGKYVLYNPGKGDSGLNTGMTATQGGLGGFAVGSNVSSAASDMKAPASLGGGVVVNVSGSEWKASTDPEFTKNNGGKAVNEATHTYDAHYLIGNYYQWLAATAQSVTEGEGVTSANTKVNNSICPANWQLPESGPNRNDNDGSFFYLLSKYAPDSTLNGGKTENGGAALTGAAQGGKTLENVLTGAPLSFLRSGVINPWANSRLARNIGNRGNFWSSVASSDTGAYYLGFNHTNVYPSDTYDRGRSFQIRCLVKSDKSDT